MIDNNELDINRQKNVTVLMDADFSFLKGKILLCENITQQTAQELVQLVAQYPTPQKSCPKVLGASYSSKAEQWVKFHDKSYTNELILNLEIGKCMKCQKKTSGMTQRDKAKLCAENIKSGKCLDTMVCKTIGTVLFPELYQKTK
ncbi:MAG: hypothetical protein IKB59_01615 [Alphaproteobacteria bacterium]|nr:hypothetical protein [Alphaproteobacteria bacterium]